MTSTATGETQGLPPSLYSRHPGSSIEVEIEKRCLDGTSAPRNQVWKVVKQGMRTD